MMAQLNYHHLRLFRTIAHEGGLTRAARRLNLSQSAVSVQLGKLEAQFGHALFDRVGRRLVLTEAGRIALDYADTVFAAGDELVRTLRGDGQAGRRLRLGALTTLSRNFQLGFLGPLLRRGDVELNLRSGSLRELLALLDVQDIDIVLANGPAPRDAPTALRSVLIDEQPLSLVAAPGRVAAGFAFPAGLDGARLLLPGRASGFRSPFDRLLDDAGVRPAIIAEVDDMAMLRLLARATGDLTLVPPIVVRDELGAGSLVECCAVPGIAERFYAIVQQRRFPNPLLAELLDPD